MVPDFCPRPFEQFASTAALSISPFIKELVYLVYKYMWLSENFHDDNILYGTT